MFRNLKRFAFSNYARLNRVPEGSEGSEGSGAGTGSEGGEGAAGNKGAGAGGAGTGAGTGTNKEETVSKAEFDKVLAELHKHKKTATTLKDAADADKTTRMKEQNQWKELAEANEKKAADALAESTRIQTSFLSEKKFSALQSKCTALGLRPEAVSDLEMLDLADITIETTSTGKVNVLGADKYAERLKTLKPHWFTDPKTLNVNTNGTRTHDKGGAVTTQDLIAAEKEARKTGNLAPYHELHKKYQTQRQAANR